MKLPRLLRRRVLVLIPQMWLCGRRNFDDIADRIMAKRPDIGVFVYGHDKYDQFKWRHRFRPTLTATMGGAPDLNVPRGAYHQSSNHSKHEEYAHLTKVGVPLPKWEILTPESTFDPEKWGKYVILKPSSGLQGRDVKFQKTTKLRFKPEKHSDDVWMVQQFIFTGEHPISYRVTTLFGKTLWCLRSTNPESGPPLTDLNQLCGQSPVATAAKGKINLDDDPEICEFAEYIAETAYPDVPLLGIDIIRCALTGKLYCCETNPRGCTWHITSGIGKALQRDNDFSIEHDTDALDLAADALIAATDKLAT